jgi:L-rhamnose mutarotase
MFTILGYKVDGIQTYNIYISIEAKMVFAKLLRKDTVTDLAFVSHHKTLSAAQAEYDRLRQIETVKIA